MKESGSGINEKLELIGKFFHMESSVTAILSELHLKPIILEYENKLKSVDIILDILKMGIPLCFTLLIAALSYPQMKPAITSLQYVLGFSCVVLMIAICIRYVLTSKYTSVYKSNCKEGIKAIEEVFDVVVTKHLNKTSSDKE